ncbi:MAG: hypothetical protein NTV53_04935 [Actinobacteria bacterium]|nr:hypothetical protein [Actinomycetota bacterium]
MAGIIIFDMMIDCQTCTMREISCSDCVVTVLLNITSSPASEISKNQISAISVLSEKGLVPPLRYAK